MISSVIPSARCSCFGSPLMFIKGSTAIEARSGKGYFILSTDATGIGEGLKYIIQMPPATNPSTTTSKIQRYFEPQNIFLFSRVSEGVLEDSAVINSGRADWGPAAIFHRRDFFFPFIRRYLLFPILLKTRNEVFPRFPIPKIPEDNGSFI